MVQATLAIVIVLLTSAGLIAPATAQASTGPSSAVIAAVRQMRLHAWNYALAQARKPYIWGGTGPVGFDCSGLVYAAYRSRGVVLPRTTYGMLSSPHLVRISKAQARRGDLAFYGSGHVELYDQGNWTYGAADSGTRIGFHRMSPWWHATMYFAVRR